MKEPSSIESTTDGAAYPVGAEAFVERGRSAGQRNLIDEAMVCGRKALVLEPMLPTGCDLYVKLSSRRRLCGAVTRWAGRAMVIYRSAGFADDSRWVDDLVIALVEASQTGEEGFLSIIPGQPFGLASGHNAVGLRRAIDLVASRPLKGQHLRVARSIAKAYGLLGDGKNALRLANLIVASARTQPTQDALADLYSAALIHMRFGKLDEAEPLLTTCLENKFFPDSAARELAARCFLEAGSLGKAKSIYDQDAFTSVDQVFRRHVKNAIDLVAERIAKGDRSSPTARYAVARLERERCRFGQAEKILAGGDDEWRARPEIVFLSSEVDLLQGRLTEARDRLEAHLRENPRDPRFLLLLGDVAHLALREEEAIALYLEALEVDPVFVAIRQWAATRRGGSIVDDVDGFLEVLAPTMIKRFLLRMSLKHPVGHAAAFRELVDRFLASPLLSEKIRRDPAGSETLICQTPAEIRHILHWSARARKGIVEIGRNLGGSTILMALAKTAIPLWSIDIAQRNDSVVRAILRFLGVDDGIDLILADSGQPHPAIGVFDMMFIDGDHTYEGVSRDLETWAPRMETGGRILLDDNGMRASSRMAVKDFVARHRRRFKLEVLPEDGVSNDLCAHGSHARIVKVA